MKSLKILVVIFEVLAAVVMTTSAGTRFYPQPQEQKSDPAAWGSDHVGKPVPEYYGGDECLFCHRFTVGQVWQKDAHFRTVRGKYKDGRDAPEITSLKLSVEKGGELAAQVDLIMGQSQMSRFLLRDNEGVIKLLTFGLQHPQSAEPKFFDLRWAHGFVGSRFSDRCIGCHMTGVDPKTLIPFESFVGCEACHGPHNPEHTKGTAVFMRFAKKAKETAQMIASSCGSCHLRGGKSRSTGKPYPHNFVSGDNLFKDFVFDFNQADHPRLNPIDAHIQKNIRNIVINGKNDLTCLSCHKMHPSDTLKHRRQPKIDYCYVCHQIEPFKERKKYEVHSAVCEY
jgi:predicted CXXCH cytochrome family protein